MVMVVLKSKQEGLIYAPIVEGNIGQIADEIKIRHRIAISCQHPNAYLVARETFWRSADAYPNASELQALITEFKTAGGVSVAA